MFGTFTLVIYLRVRAYPSEALMVLVIANTSLGWFVLAYLAITFTPAYQAKSLLLERTLVLSRLPHKFQARV